ncbi:MAG: NUDIX domain-containing protein [Betaproteobacteria bacterium]
MAERLLSTVQLISELDRAIELPQSGLPEDLFLFVSRITPLVNVDLLIQDQRKRTLLTWRSDAFFGPGWHVPGGIVRYKEMAATRICSVARIELGATVEFDPSPVLVQESIDYSRRDRAHSVSLLYRCRLTGELAQELECRGKSPLPGQWRWHSGCPANLIHEQRSYAAFM